MLWFYLNNKYLYFCQVIRSESEFTTLTGSRQSLGKRLPNMFYPQILIDMLNMNFGSTSYIFE